MLSNILIITDDDSVAQRLEKKIILLRETDCLQKVTSDVSFNFLKKQQPVLIFYHLVSKEGGVQKFLNFLQKVKQTEELNVVSIILVYEEIDENTFCLAFEKGITDFLSLYASDSEYTIRTIWALQKRNKDFQMQNSQNILAQLNIIDGKNYVYTENYSRTVIKNMSKKEWGSFCILAPDVNVRSKLSPQVLMNFVKKSIRSTDIIGYGPDFKIYLWLKETNSIDTLKILEKMKNTFSSEFTISIAFMEVKDISFDEAEKLTSEALSKALLQGDCVVCAKEVKPVSIQVDENIKNFRFNKRNMVKKIESVLSPLFYQMQKIYEEKLFETKINQIVGDEMSNFVLENIQGKGTFVVVYSGYTKIDVCTKYYIRDRDVISQKYCIDYSDFSEQEISKLLNSFIKDFQNYTNS